MVNHWASIRVQCIDRQFWFRLDPGWRYDSWPKGALAWVIVRKSAFSPKNKWSIRQSGILIAAATLSHSAVRLLWWIWWPMTLHESYSIAFGWLNRRIATCIWRRIYFWASISSITWVSGRIFTIFGWVQLISFVRNCWSTKSSVFSAGKSTLVIRQGLTSDSPLLDQFEWHSNGTKPLKNYMTSLASGFYISFIGLFDSDTELALAYTAFSYMGESLLSTI